MFREALGFVSDPDGQKRSLLVDIAIIQVRDVGMPASFSTLQLIERLYERFCFDVVLKYESLRKLPDGMVD